MPSPTHNNKRPPPSPIVAPVDHGDVAAAEAEEPPPKLPRLDGGGHGEGGIGDDAAVENEHDVGIVKDVDAAPPPAVAAVAVAVLPPDLGGAAAPQVKREEAAAASEAAVQHVDVSIPQPTPLEPPTEPAPVAAGEAALPPPSPIANPIKDENAAGVSQENVAGAAATGEEGTESQAHDVNAEAAKAVDMAIDTVNAPDVSVPTTEAQEVKKTADEVTMAKYNEKATLQVVESPLPVPLDSAKEEPKDAGDNMATALAVDGVDITAKAEDELLLPVVVPLPTQQAKEEMDSTSPKKAKKERKEFTAEEKIHIISELSGPNPVSVQALLQKYGVSKSSLHRWRQPEKFERLQEMVKGARSGGNGNSATLKRDRLKKRDMNDKLVKVKLGLQEFCENNMKMDEDHQLAITSTLIQLKAVEIKDELLERHQANPILTEEEVTALQSFKGSKSWACLIGNQLGYLSTAAGSIKWTEKAKANTASYLETHSRKPTKPKKQRMEFTAQEKVAILQELEDTNKQHKTDGTPLMTVEEICAKYHTSKSSLHRWKQQYRCGQLKELAKAGSGFSQSKRIFTDKLQVIKRILNDFYVENENAPMDKKVTVTYSALQSRAIMAKESLLDSHHAALLEAQEQTTQKDTKDNSSGDDGDNVKREGEENPKKPEEQPPESEATKANKKGGSDTNSGILTKEEVSALEHFKASNSWLRETAKKYGWKLDMDAKRDHVGTIHPVAYPEVYHHPHELGEQQPLHDAHHPDGAAAAHPMAIDVEHHPVVAAVAENPATEHHPSTAPAGEHSPLGGHPEMAQHQIEGKDGIENVVTAALEGHTPNENVVQAGQHEEQQQPEDHLAPNMAVYDAQGNVMPEMLADPLVPMESNSQDGSGAVDQNENIDTIQI